MLCRRLMLLALFALLLSSNGFAQIGWKWGYGSGTDTVHTLLGVAADTARSMYTAGSFSTGASRTQHLHVKKTDSTGNVKWRLIADSCKQSDALEVVADKAGHVYILAEYAGTRWSAQQDTLYNTDTRLMYFLLKCSAKTGTILWAKNIANSFNYVADNPFQGKVGVDSEGHAYVAGGFIGKTTACGTITLTNADTSGITTDVFVAKYDTLGALLWAKCIGGDNEEKVQRTDPVTFAVTKSGNSYLSVAYLSPTITLGATTVTNPSPLSTKYRFLAKMDPNGNFTWVQPLGRHIMASDIAVDAGENLFVTGQIDSATAWGGVPLNTAVFKPIYGFNIAAFVAMLSPMGAVKWAKTDTLSFSGGITVAPDACGNFWVGGELGIYPGDSISFGGDTIISAAGSWGASFYAQFDTTGARKTGFSLPGGCKSAGWEPRPKIAVSRGSLFVGGNYYNTYIPMGADTFTNIGTGINKIFTGRYRYNLSPCAEGDTVVVVKAGVEYTVPDDLQLFPNPATDQLTIGGAALHHVVIYNMPGQELLSQHHHGETQANIDTQNLPPGMYILKVNDAVVKRFVKW